MTTILAIESSSDRASVALAMDERLICRELSGVQTHSDGLLPAIRALLVEAELRLADCDAIAFGVGPGAFTGVRTACGVVQGMAFAESIPVIPVVSLQAMAEAGRILFSACDDFICILDARMGEVYWAQYRYQGNEWHIVSEPQLSLLNEVAVCAPNALFVIGDGIEFPALYANNLLVKLMPHAKQIATLGAKDFAAGKTFDASYAQPLYLRNKIAQTTAERLAAKVVP